MVMAVITSPANHKRLGRYREISRRLALAEGLSETEARALAGEGKAVVLIDGGLHATEMLGSPAAHRAGLADGVSRDDAESGGSSTTSSCWPARQPRRPGARRPTGTCAERTRQADHDGLPVLYQKYVGHDNNRDFYMVTQPETEAISRVMYREWFPQIVYNHHQTGPAGTVLFAPPFRDPFNYYFDPLVPAGIELVGAAMHSRFVAEGKPGATMRSGAAYSTWWNGGLRSTSYFHNMIGILTETIGSPTPMQIPFVPQTASQERPPDTPSRRRDGISGSRSSIRSPPTGRSSTWRPACREELLLKAISMGRNTISEGSRDNWTVTPDKLDRGRRSRPQKRTKSSRRDTAQGFPLKFYRHAARSRRARPAGLHPEAGSAGFRDGDEAGERAHQKRRDRSPGGAAVRGRWPVLSRGLLRRQLRPGVPAPHPGHVRAPESPPRRSLSGRPPRGPL